MPMKKIRVVLFDDSTAIRDAMSLLLRYSPGLDFIAAFDNAVLLHDKIKQSEPDVVLMDIDMPEVNGIEATAMLRVSYNHIKVLMYTVFDDQLRIFQGLCAGAHGYLLKNKTASGILQAIKEVYEVGAHLTPDLAHIMLEQTSNDIPTAHDRISTIWSNQEEQILKLLSEGKPIHSASTHLGISNETLYLQINSICHKLHKGYAGRAAQLTRNPSLINLHYPNLLPKSR